MKLFQYENCPLCGKKLINNNCETTIMCVNIMFPHFSQFTHGYSLKFSKFTVFINHLNGKTRINDLHFKNR
jgi:hypothetical protein